MATCTALALMQVAAAAAAAAAAGASTVFFLKQETFQFNSRFSEVECFFDPGKTK
jgi:hypothetical protein